MNDYTVASLDERRVRFHCAVRGLFFRRWPLLPELEFPTIALAFQYGSIGSEAQTSGFQVPRDRWLAAAGFDNVFLNPLPQAIAKGHAEASVLGEAGGDRDYAVVASGISAPASSADKLVFLPRSPYRHQLLPKSEDPTKEAEKEAFTYSFSHAIAKQNCCPRLAGS